MQMLKPIEESSENKTLLRIEQVKVQVMAKLLLLAFQKDHSVRSSICQEIVANVKANADYWRAKWCIRIRRGILGKYTIINMMIMMMMMTNR